MSEQVHANNNDSMLPNHLYQIDDQLHGDVFKYGITADPLPEDGSLPARPKYQITLYNKVARWLRFTGKIIMRNIKGRAKAKEIEQQLIDEYTKKHGRPPVGNQ